MFTDLNFYRRGLKWRRYCRRRRPRRAQYAVFCGDGRPANGARTRDPIEAYRWLGAALAGGYTERWLGVRQRGAWRRAAPVLRVPELREVGQAVAGGGEVRRARPREVAGGGEVSVRRARLRAASLLGCRGLDGVATASLLTGYEGFFPSVDVGVTRMLQARLGGQHSPWLRRLDMPGLLRDLIAGAVIWTVVERGDRRWPAGVHLFTARSHRATRRGGDRRLSHVMPR